MSDRIELYDTELHSMKLAKKTNGIWIDATGELTGREDAPNNTIYPCVKSKNYTEYFMYYPLKVPVRTSNFTLWFGTEENVRNNIKFGLYSMDFEPILEYDNGIIEDSDNQAVYFPDDLISGEHWFKTIFNDDDDEILFQMSQGDGIDDLTSHQLSDTSINTHQLCYVGIKIRGNSNAATWIERIRIHYDKETVRASLRLDKSEFQQPEAATAKLKITTEFGDIINYDEFQWSCRVAYVSPPEYIGTITSTSHNGNEHHIQITDLVGNTRGYDLKVVYAGDDTFDSFSKSEQFYYKERTSTWILFNVAPKTYYYPNYIPVVAELYDASDNPIASAPLKIYFKLTNSDTLIVESTRQTEGDGTMVTNISPNAVPPRIDETYEVWIEFEGDANNQPASTPHKLIRYVKRSKMTVDKTGNNETLPVKSPVHLSVKLTDWDDNALSNETVRYNVIIDDVIKDAGTITSAQDGTLSLDYANYIKGDVDSTIEFIFEGITSDALLGCSTSFTTSWTKIDTSWTIYENDSVTEVTKALIFRAKLSSTDNYTFAKAPVIRTIRFTDLDGNSTDNIKLYNSLGNLIPLADVQGFSMEISSNSIATFEGYSMVGDTKATVKFMYMGNDLYNASEISKVLQWNKIQTQVTASDITHYSGRFTLLEDNPELDPSPGVDEEYKNFRATVTPINTTNNYVVNEGTLRWKNRSSSTIYMQVDVTNGEGKGRTTRNLSGNNISQSTQLVVMYSGSDIFKQSTAYVEFTTLKRVTTTINTNFDDIYGSPKRYNVPFNWRTDLKDTSDNGIGNQTVIYYVNGVLEYTRTTSAYGLCTVQEYTPLFVGTLRVTTRFNEQDTVDKYLPSSDTDEIEIDKDTTTITGSTDNTHTTCDDADVTFTLKDSLNRPLVDKKIKIKEDDGTGDSPAWTNMPEILYTNSNGTVTYTSEAYSVVKLVKGLFDGTNYYYNSENVQHVDYQITKNFTVNLNNGVATVPIDCIINAQKGIPNGLYDVELEYVPPTTENGQCPLYGASTKKQYIRKKTPTYLECLTENLSTEPYKPLYLTTELTDYTSVQLSDMNEWSYINGFHESSPPHVTDENGQITRGGWVSTIQEPLVYYFLSEQTKKYACAELEVEANIVKITPTLDTDDLTGYSGVKMDLEAELYHEYKKYDAYGIEIKRDATTGAIIQYNPLNNSYYKEVDGVGTTSNQTEYNNAQSITTKIPIANKKITWYGVDGTTELASGTTDNNGVATTQYGRVSVGVNTIYVGVEGDNKYQPVKIPIHITTLARLPVYFEEIDFYETDNNGNYVRAATYHHPYTLYTRLYRDVDGQRVPFANQEIQFSKDVFFGTVTTDSNGYVELTHVIDTTIKFPYQVYFYSLGIYQSTKQVYRIPVMKQTPILTLTSSNNNPKVGDRITLTAKLTEDVTSGKTPLPSRGITFFDGTDGLEYHKTGDNGICTMTYKLRYAGTHALKAIYNTQNDAYNAVEGTLNLTVIKTNTHFEPKKANPLTIPGLTADTVTVVLKDAFNDPLQSKNVTITYNGQTTTKKTNGEGEISLSTGKFDKDDSKTMAFSFAGDDNYNSSTYNYTINWGEYLDVDNCTDLSTFDTLLENYYASDGSAKWGLDVDGSYKNNTAPIPGVSGSPQCKKCIQGTCSTGVCLRLICGDLKTSGQYDPDSESVEAPTGVVMRNKTLVTSSKCTMRFKFMIKYDGSNNKKYSSSNDLIGGHLGLMEGTATTGERSPARFEFFRRNAYFITMGGNATGSGFKGKLYPNKEYTFEFKFNDRNVTGKLFDADGNQLATESQTGSRTFENLHPYVFAFTNGTSFVMKELRIIRED